MWQEVCFDHRLYPLKFPKLDLVDTRTDPIGPCCSRRLFDLPPLPGGVVGLSPFRHQRQNTTTIIGSSFIGAAIVGNPSRSPNTTPHTTPPTTPRGQRSASHLGSQPNTRQGTSQTNPLPNQNFVFSQVGMVLTSQSPFFALFDSTQFNQADEWPHCTQPYISSHAHEAPFGYSKVQRKESGRPK